jgi:hypothetical protein
MATVKIIISYARLKDDELDTKSQVIINGMTGNPNFATPVPTLADVTTARTNYVAALTAAQQGGKQETATKNQTRKALEDILRLLGLYVQANCQNSETIALSSGFDIQRAPGPIGVLAKPESFVAESGPTTGTMEVSCDRITGARSYVFETTAAPVTDASVWTSRFATSKAYVFDSLTPGKQYAFRMAGIGADPMLVYSDVLLRYVQ